MTRKEMNLLNMFKSTDLFLTANKDLLKNFEPIIASGGRIKTGIDVIETLSEKQAKDTKVHTELKVNEKDVLDKLTLKVSTAMSAVAAATNNVELKLVSDLKKSNLIRMRENDYFIKVQSVYKSALPLAAQLVVWGVTADDIEALNTMSNSLQKRTPDIRNVKVVTKQSTAELKQKVAEINLEIKDTLDKLMKPMNVLNPTLYGQYTNARKILDKAATQKPTNKEIMKPVKE